MQGIPGLSPTPVCAQLAAGSFAYVTVLLPYFTSGPFAWSGLFAIWIPTFIFIF